MVNPKCHISWCIVHRCTMNGTCIRYIISFYRPQRSCGKVMFLHLSVILFMGWGVCHPLDQRQTPPRQTPPAQCMLGYTHPTQCMLGNTTPVQSMLGYGQQAGGTHPTGMHSCLMIFSFDLNNKEVISVPLPYPWRSVNKLLLTFQDAIYRIKEHFNKEFDSVYERKEQEICED